MELPNYFINLHQSAPTGKCHHIFRFHYKKYVHSTPLECGHLGPSCAIDITLLWSGRVEAVAILVILEPVSIFQIRL